MDKIAKWSLCDNPHRRNNRARNRKSTGLVGGSFFDLHETVCHRIQWCLKAEEIDRNTVEKSFSKTLTWSSWKWIATFGTGTRSERARFLFHRTFRLSYLIIKLNALSFLLCTRTLKENKRWYQRSVGSSICLFLSISDFSRLSKYVLETAVLSSRCLFFFHLVFLIYLELRSLFFHRRVYSDGWRTRQRDLLFFCSVRYFSCSTNSVTIVVDGQGEKRQRVDREEYLSR